MTRCTRRYRRDYRLMKTRIFAVLLFSVAVLSTLCWNASAWAQTDVRRVGVLTFLDVREEPTLAVAVERLQRNIAAFGWVEGKNVSFVYRSANGDPSQMAAAAHALVDLGVDLIWAASAPATRAAYEATRTIPILAYDQTTDPVAESYALSYGHPGGNLTGVFLDAPAFAGKWFELLQEIVPDLSQVAVLWDPAPGTTHLIAARTIAASLNIKTQILEVRTSEDIERAFDSLEGRPQALVILPSPLLWFLGTRLAELALQYQLPATSMSPFFASAGGAISYGPDINVSDTRFAHLLARVLGGANPGDLPIERPTNMRLVVNLKTAKSLGITIPQSILLRADEVIQ